MKKTILTTLTAAVVAGTAALVAPAAEAAGKLVVFNHAAGVVIAVDQSTPPGTTHNDRHRHVVYTGQKDVFHWEEENCPQCSWNKRATDGNKVEAGIEWAGYGLNTYKIPKEGERHIHIHGNGFSGFWVTESEFGAVYQRGEK